MAFAFVEGMKITVAARSHVGRRQNNEDALVVCPEHGLFAVADGMGGYEGGEIASGIVVQTLQGFFQRNAHDGEATWPHKLDERFGFVANELSTGIVLAHRAVVAQKTGRLEQMGSTVVALAIDGEMAVIAHVGDSRAYRLRHNVLERLTIDHSYAELMRAAGGSAPAGFSHVITRAIGRPDEGPPELRRVELQVGDVYLLCSDGVSDVLEHRDIHELLTEYHDPELAASALVQDAYLAGGQDNITAVVLRIERN